MTFALSIPLLIGATGLAVDSASFYNQQSRMQSVADASALAAAKELHLYRKDVGALKEAHTARAETLLAQAGLADSPHSISVSVEEKQNRIDVDLTVVAYGFLPPQIWGENPISVSSRAVAFGQSKLCVLALHGSKSDAIKADGSAVLTAPECAVQSNSGDPNGLNVADDSRLVSSLICSSGGAKGGGSSYEPQPETDCPQLDDPLASRPTPPIAGCTFNDLVVSTSQTLPGNAVFCGGLKIEKGAVVTLSPGTYVISGGKLEVKDNSKLIGDYVSFYFQDDAAVFTFDKDTTIDLGAPKDGAMAGMLFYENPLSADGRAFTIKSEHAQRLLGTIYLPKGKLDIDSTGNVAEQSAYTIIVASEVHVKGANLVVNADYGGTDVPVPDGVGPNSSMAGLTR